jgi:Cd2+/Zn2+-exporting ATPase
VAPETVSVGALVAVKPGERVPLDGVVAEGLSALDTSALTGESLPRDVGPGDTALAGSINVSGLLVLEVTKPFGASTVSKILALVRDAGHRKARSERFITRFSKVYTPVVLGAALILALAPPLLVPGASWGDWVSRALVFLVVSCPCALVLSVPLSYFAGIGGASRRGILIKGGNYLEALSRVDTVVFDKTGTLTRGAFTVSRVEDTDAFPGEALLEIAAHAECHSNHPIALSVRRAYGRVPDAGRVSDYTELAGRGVRARVDGRPVLAGGLALLTDAGLVPPSADGGADTAVWLAVDGVYAGRILLSDDLKVDGPAAVRALRAAGVRRVVMLTGDRAAAAQPVAAALGLDDFRADLLPPQKVAEIEALAAQKQTGGSLVFVGDGLNDAPALARSDVGVAMGGVGSDAALEAADVVLMTDEPSKLAEAVSLARRTQGIVRQNIAFALGVKAVLLLLGALGLLPMWAAVFGDVGVALLAVLNATRGLARGIVRG